MKSMKMFYIALAMIGLILFTAACGGDTNDSQDEADTTENTETENTENEEAASEERTLTDAVGNEVTIPADPQNIIASYLEDYLVALDVTPAAQWSVQGGESVQGYLQDSLGDVPTIPYDLPLESVASFEPDLLLMDSAGMVEGNKYDQYSRIAPTYVVGEAQNNDWRTELERVGEVLGKEDEAAQILEDYEQNVEETKTAVQDAIGDDSIAAIWLVGNTFYVVNDQLSAGDVLYNDLGVTAPNVVQEIANSSESNWSEISLEKLAQLDADHIILINDDGEGSEMLQDEIWQNIPAVQNGNIYEYASEDSSWLYTGPIANEMMLEDIKESLVE
ncbi:ABC transporter substrate-binding protein [Halobacillus locisalis]|uniref:ABC transporter substrate-binding protein n=1 Tax=Halobacillus locisalis TaxID=220753 RepID=A0A838CW99_9BACI|nr:ABC transporter substrate-binding protein [Halobacillus locisalis]MBA2176240.1 ABC transporter substrate-binding protein [Halobacillus locisalis]